MAASVFDSPLFAQLFPTQEYGRLFSDSADVRAMLLVLGALAKVQGAQEVIPALSAAAIHRASLEIQLDPGALAQATGQNGVPLPGLVAAFRAEMNAPEHSQYVHWGATSQDIMDTGLMLRMRQALILMEADLTLILKSLGRHARAYTQTPMAARTYGQIATPTSWGALCATWGAPLLDALGTLETLRRETLFVSLAGAAGTASALGPKALETRAKLASALGLNDPQRNWHSDRSPIVRIATWMSMINTHLASLGQSLIGLSASGIDEASLAGAGASSTMPQKQNPVAPSALVALSHMNIGLMASLRASAAHQYQRDGAAWFGEWLALPQIVLGCGSALKIAATLCEKMAPNADQMAENIGALGLVHAEALSFALAETMPRPKAQAITKELVKEAIAQRMTLRELALQSHRNIPTSVFTPAKQMGHAPQDALRFADKIDAL